MQSRIDGRKPRHRVSLPARVSLGAMLLLLLSAASPAQPSSAPDRHPQGATCASCHLTGDAVTADDAYRLTAPQEQLCARCHQAAVDFGHPSGVPASRPSPAELPLDHEGNVTCSTCHQVHAAAPGRLRSVRLGAAFCESCHEPDFFRGMRDGGQSVLRSGHLSVPPGLALLAVDRYSAQCLACHADRGNGDARRARRSARHGYGARNHPIGKEYQRWLGYGGYRQPGSIPSAIRLPDGMVSCVSCHEGYTSEHGRLVMANDESQICYGCHDL